MGDIRQDHVPEGLLGLLSEVSSPAELQRRAAAAGIDFSSLLMGTITWDSSVGELLTRPMADAFLVTVSGFHYEQDQDTGLLVELPEPKRVTLFDGRDEGTRHKVHFIASACSDGAPFRVEAGFSNKAAWKRLGRFSILLGRRILPSVQRIEKKGQDVLKPIEVRPRWFFGG